MRILATTGVLASLFLATGCMKLLSGYYAAPKHFLLGSTDVQQSDKNVDKAYHATLEVLKERGYGISRKELESESAMIRANKGSAEVVIDITSQGDGSQIRIEADEGGMHAELWELMRYIEMMP